MGDIVLLKEGMEVPGDGIMIGGFNLHIDESSMTGETKPMHKDLLEKCVEKKQMLIKEKGIEKIQHHDVPTPVILAGTKVVNGGGTMLVVNIGKNSSIGKISKIVENDEDELTPL